MGDASKKPDDDKRSSEWSAFRAKHIAEKCVVCEGTENLELHHIEPFHKNHARELDPNNVITVCEHPGRNCHLNIAHLGDFRGWNPDIRDDADHLLSERKLNKHRIARFEAGEA